MFSCDIRAELHEIGGQMLPLPHLSPGMAAIHDEMMQGELSAVEMDLSIELSGGDWLNVGTRFERPPLQWPLYSTLAFAMTASPGHDDLRSMPPALRIRAEMVGDPEIHGGLVVSVREMRVMVEATPTGSTRHPSR